jgi:hypothetical protein
VLSSKPKYKGTIKKFNGFRFGIPVVPLSEKIKEEKETDNDFPGENDDEYEEALSEFYNAEELKYLKHLRKGGERRRIKDIVKEQERQYKEDVANMMGLC